MPRACAQRSETRVKSSARRRVTAIQPTGEGQATPFASVPRRRRAGATEECCLLCPCALCDNATVDTNLNMFEHNTLSPHKHSHPGGSGRRGQLLQGERRLHSYDIPWALPAEPPATGLGGRAVGRRRAELRDRGTTFPRITRRLSRRDEDERSLWQQKGSRGYVPGAPGCSLAPQGARCA